MTSTVDPGDAHGMLQYNPGGVVYNRVPQPLDPLQEFASTLSWYVELAMTRPTMTAADPVATPSIRDKADSAALLQYDPGAMVIGQVGNPDMLNKLKHFASRLQHFIDLANSPLEEEEQPVPEAVVSEESPQARPNSVSSGEEAAAAQPRHFNDRELRKQRRRARRSAAGPPVQPDAVPSQGDVPTARGNPEQVQNPTAARLDVVASAAPVVPTANTTNNSDRHQEGGQNSADSVQEPVATEEKNQNSTGPARLEVVPIWTFRQSPTNSSRLNQHMSDAKGGDRNVGNQGSPPEIRENSDELPNPSLADDDELVRGMDVATLTEPPPGNGNSQPAEISSLQHMPPHPGMLLARHAMSTRSRAADTEDNLPIAQLVARREESQENSKDNSTAASVSAAQRPSEIVTSMKRENEISPDQPKSKRRRRDSRKTKGKIKEEDLPELPEAPKIEAPPGYNGKLSHSQLKRSVGVTRAVLNQHLGELGLSANFAMGVVSSRSGKISHMTLNSQWNELPYSESQLLTFWLGEGERRLTIISPLDPDINPDHPAIPLFWAQKKAGGARCHYVGHFRCVKFDKTQKVMLKEERRQALLEFKLVEFKMDIAEKMSDIANQIRNPSVREVQQEAIDSQSVHRHRDVTPSVTSDEECPESSWGSIVS